MKIGIDPDVSVTIVDWHYCHTITICKFIYRVIDYLAE